MSVFVIMLNDSVIGVAADKLAAEWIIEEDRAMRKNQISGAGMKMGLYYHIHYFDVRVTK